MSIRQLLTLILKHKWLILAPAIGAPILALVLLLFVEPAFVSSCKLWAKERQEGSQLLRVQRPGMQETTYAEVQRELITSHRVLNRVIDRLKLDTPPPSQSLWAKLTGRGQLGLPSTDPAQVRFEALRALTASVWVEIINPEIISISVRMNSPTLAQETLTAVLTAYREEYQAILSQEITEYRRFLTEQMADLETTITGKETALTEFESSHPEILGGTATPAGSATSTGGPPLDFVKRMGDMSPVPTIYQDLARLEMERNRAATRFGSESDTLKKLDEQIARNQALLKKYLARLSTQARLAIQHRRLQWELKEARSHYSEINTEYHRILVSQGTKVKQVSSIAMLNAPSLDTRPVAPKKKATLLAASFLGLLIGLGLAYLAHLLDRTYHLREELAADTGLPVLAAVPRRDQPGKDG
ncbi:MAG: GumC family protein [Planctomycetota bacterium]|jgi:uncharacterized protein involved in exopolysaccharide biosynthesis